MIKRHGQNNTLYETDTVYTFSFTSLFKTYPTF